MIKGLSHVAVRVTDLERAIAFYCDGLGLKEKFRLNGSDGGVMLAYIQVAPGQFLELFPGGVGGYADDSAAGPVHLCLEVDDIQASYREITGRGIASLHGEPVLGADGSWQFWVKDPDETRIEFHQFTDESLQLR